MVGFLKPRVPEAEPGLRGPRKSREVTLALQGQCWDRRGPEEGERLLEEGWPRGILQHDGVNTAFGVMAFQRARGHLRPRRP